MKLSAIIISYNEKPYLAEAIESCLRQKCEFPVEIIIGDDGSNDGSIELIEAYQKKYPETIRYFVMDRTDVKDVIPSIRVSNVLKRAFAEARGTYLTVMSGDDVLLDDEKFCKQVHFLEANPHHAGCYTDFKLFWSDGEEKPILVPQTANNAFFWGNLYVHISCWVFRRTVLNCLLDRFCDDTGLLFSILKTGKVARIPAMAFGYRQRDKSIMHKADEMELCILELCLFQDTLNGGGLQYASFCRFWRPVKWIFEHREQLSGQKYKKYRENCALYDNDVLSMLGNYDCLSAYHKIGLICYLVLGRMIKPLYRIRAFLARRLSFQKNG